jgi:hypothetical protein
MCVDRATRRPDPVTELDDPAIGDADVSRECSTSRTVDNRSAGELQIEHQLSFTL